MIRKINNDEFYKKSKLFVISALTLLKRTGDSVLGDLGALALSDCVWRHHSEFIQLPEYADCLRIMEADEVLYKHVNQNVGAWDFSVPRTAWNYLSYLLIRSQPARPYGQFEFYSDAFDQAYEQLEIFLYSDYMLFKVFAILYGFESDVDVIKLDEDLHIRKIEDEKLPSGLLAEKYLFKWPQSNYVVELNYKEKKVFGELRGDAPSVDEEDELGKLLLALRVFKEGSITLRSIKKLPANDLSMAGTTSKTIFVEKKPVGLPYELTGTEIEKFGMFWSMFKKMDFKIDPSFAVVVQRFNYGSQRKRYEDMLIDLFIAFEALLLREKENYIKEKLASRTARLLGNDDENQEATIKEQMRQLYAVRSNVVHGRSRESALKSALQLERLLKESIKRFVFRLRDRDHDGIISDLSTP